MCFMDLVELKERAETNQLGWRSVESVAWMSTGHPTACPTSGIQSCPKSVTDLPALPMASAMIQKRRAPHS